MSKPYDFYYALDYKVQQGILVGMGIFFLLMFLFFPLFIFLILAWVSLGIWQVSSAIINIIQLNSRDHKMYLLWLLIIYVPFFGLIHFYGNESIFILALGSTLIFAFYYLTITKKTLAHIRLTRMANPFDDVLSHLIDDESN